MKRILMFRYIRERAEVVSVGVLAVALSTFIAFWLHLDLTVIAFVHLLIVVLAARRRGFVAASIVSATAVVGQLYFFVPPFLSWSVADPHNFVALATFEYCALIVSRLSNQAAQQTKLAWTRQMELEALYSASSQVLLFDPAREPGPQAITLIQDVFGCSAVAVFDSRVFHGSHEDDPRLDARLRDAYTTGVDSFDEQDQTWVRVLRMGTRSIGALGLRGGRISEAVATALASLVAIAIERARSVESESRAEIARRTEHLRTAVLDAFAHDVKTPLTSIRAASSGLLEAGALGEGETEMVRLIDEECAHITALTDRILRMARLDARDVHPRRGRVDLVSLIEEAVRSAQRRAPERKISVRSFSGSPVASGDPQLLALALNQLLDNALKYSTPGTEISFVVRQQEDETVVSVHNFGPVIAAGEIENIFERFYRAAPAGPIAGTGLGLSITRKIVAAHSGRVWAASDVKSGTTFFLTLPAAGQAQAESEEEELV